MSIREGITNFNMFALSLEMHLYMIVDKEIGRKSFMADGLGTLRIRDKLVELIPLLRQHVSKKDNIA